MKPYPLQIRPFESKLCFHVFPPKIRNKEVCFHDEFASSQELVANTSCLDASQTTQPVQEKFCVSPLYDNNGEKIKKREKKKETENDREELRKSYCGIGEKEVDENYKDAVDWDAVRRCLVKELSKIIIDRGVQNKLAKRIKADFLDRIYKEHGSLDLECGGTFLNHHCIKEGKNRVQFGIKCSICQEEFVRGDKIGSLKCGHEDHTPCINQWLQLKNWCPICKASPKPSSSSSPA